MNAMNLMRRLQLADQRRGSLPGEHWATFGLGLGLLRAARRSRSPLLRAAGWVGAGLLVARAASGRDGPLARWGKR
ncbi:MAG TPA: hypothetical protein VFR90_06880 [Methylibium sp.]|uniref:hypothetical protein n=1 Tax=Methylibium sp. TaxID=2067992 RepID=UPI002DBEA8EC|nr:hypothetical protein [Methylibium sp.]HEU4458830.1 hypothetical protein [Methylibium sp.]